MLARLIAFDLDGTLLDADNRVSPYTAAVLERAAKEHGLVLVAASGRGRSAAEHVLQPVPGVDYVICSNGALLYRRSTEEILHRHALAPRRVREFHTVVNSLLEGACWAWDTAKGIVPDPSFREVATRPGRELHELIAPPHLELPDDPGVPIDQRLAPFGRIWRQLLLHGEMTCWEVYIHLIKHLQEPLTRSSASFLEITAPRVNKRAALKALCARLGIPTEDVVAFGDHMNDRTMLRWAGRGIAMSDGYGPLLEEIPEHTEAGHDADGVALTIERLLDGL
jgi:HAD superfamily hydrolase (TIGR01484 family)